MTNVTVQEALKAAIDWFDNVTDMDYSSHSVKRKLQMALAEIDKCEPVARFVSKRLTPEGTQEFFGFLLVDSIPPLSLLYTSPQPRDWVSLSDGDIRDVFRKFGWTANQVDFEDARAIEAKLKQLNTKG